MPILQFFHQCLIFPNHSLLSQREIRISPNCRASCGPAKGMSNGLHPLANFRIAVGALLHDLSYMSSRGSVVAGRPPMPAGRSVGGCEHPRQTGLRPNCTDPHLELMPNSMHMSDPSGIGAGMAVALITTLYRAIIFNVLVMPFVKKLGYTNRQTWLDSDYPRVHGGRLPATSSRSTRHSDWEGGSTGRGAYSWCSTMFPALFDVVIIQ